MSGEAATVAAWKAGLALPGRPNEWEGKRLLSGLGIGVPKGTLIGAEQRLDESLSAMSAEVPFPWAVKVCSAEVLHKTDRGGVILGVGEGEAASAIAEMRKRFPGAAILVEEMASHRGCEIILGALHDPAFGPAVMAGAGGIFTELYQDVAFRLAPCTAREAVRMLEELTIYPALRGYRGLEADVEALAAMVERLGGLAVELIGPGDELDINPVVWAHGRWVALDVKVVLAEGARLPPAPASSSRRCSDLSSPGSPSGAQGARESRR